MTLLLVRSAMPVVGTHAPAGLRSAPARPDASVADTGIASLASERLGGEEK